MNEFELSSDDLFDNPTPRLAVTLCLDTSGSMAGPPIEELNQGLQAFYEAINSHELAKLSAEVAIVTFAKQAKVVQDFMPIDDVTPPRIEIDQDCGGTALGAGVGLGLDRLDARKQLFRESGLEYYQPWVVMISDGQPTDQVHLQVAPRVQGMVEKKKLSVFALAVGTAADIGALAMLSPARPPLRLKGLNFAGFFEFLGKSVGQVTDSRPGDSLKLVTDGIEAWAEV